MKSKENINAVCYARFSSDNQRNESIDAQIRAIKKYALEKNINIIDFYIDRCKTGTNDDRPEFIRMIKDSEKGIFDYVLVHKLDRFSRNRYDSAIYRKKLKDNNISLISVMENLDGSPESILLESLIEGVNEYYSENLSREIKKGLNENALKCLHNGGTPPFGFDVFEKKICN